MLVLMILVHVSTNTIVKRAFRLAEFPPPNHTFYLAQKTSTHQSEIRKMPPLSRYLLLHHCLPIYSKAFTLVSRPFLLIFLLGAGVLVMPFVSSSGAAADSSPHVS